MRGLLHLAQQLLFCVGVLRLLPLIDLGKDDSNTLGVEVLCINPPLLLDSFVALILEAERNLASGPLVL